MFRSLTSRWLIGAGILLPAGTFAASCTAETHVNLLDECDSPGASCGTNRVCNDSHQCVPVDEVVVDGGSPVSDSGVVDLTDGDVRGPLDGACGTWESRSEPLPTSLMLVVDISRSMNDPAPGGGTRWEVTRQALHAALDTLPATTEVGMLLFPNQRTELGSEPLPSSTCVNVEAMVPIAALGPGHSSQHEKLDQALYRANVGEAAPTHDAYVVARAELERSAPVGDPYLLLITDGQPTLSLGCIGTEGARGPEPVAVGPIIEEIADARASGIRTFLIGSPGSEQTSEDDEDARTWLSRAASAGGTAKELCSHAGPTFCHFDMVDEPDFSVALGDALREIRARMLPCEYPLPEPANGNVIDPAAVNVVWSPGDDSQKLFLRNDAEDCNEGWHYVDGGSRIALCSQSCERVQAARDSSLTLLFGCETEALIY